MFRVYSFVLLFFSSLILFASLSDSWDHPVAIYSQIEGFSDSKTKKEKKNCHTVRVCSFWAN